MIKYPFTEKAFRAEANSRAGLEFAKRTDLHRILHLKRGRLKFLPVGSQEEVDLCQKVAKAAYDMGLPCFGIATILHVAKRLEPPEPTVWGRPMSELRRCRHCGLAYEEKGPD